MISYLKTDVMAVFWNLSTIFVVHGKKSKDFWICNESLLNFVVSSPPPKGAEMLYYLHNLGLMNDYGSFCKIIEYSETCWWGRR